MFISQKMSWLFGKKKHHRDSPTETPTESEPPSDDYIFVERRQQDPPPNVTPYPGMYPSLHNIGNQPATSYSLPNQVAGHHVPKQASVDNPAGDISNIPFRFCRELERNMNEDLIIDKLRLDEIESFIKRINIKDYEYTFSLERDIISELDSQNEEE
ncbi:uncharacterized protein LOC106658949 isoform X1 [Trichogramma pretiosum]|uniref:uncharacterized protein LOC106658949 isoform X1 n=2 Tax=Trichogramma pretiosum TaxID=7493 RepID=UPI0006C9AD04|nr:uncharacterized protein LOC106658949 isoform X1 [Trichogramma pretiosum]